MVSIALCRRADTSTTSLLGYADHPGGRPVEVVCVIPDTDRQQASLVHRIHGDERLSPRGAEAKA
jgi:hypothetical protein